MLLADWEIVVAIAQGHHLVAFQMLVAAIPEVIAAFLRGRCRAIAVNNRQIKQLVIVKPGNRTGKDGIDTTGALPAAKRPVDPRVVNLGQSLSIPVDWQHLPLTAHIERLQDVVEDPVERQGRFWAAPATTVGQMRQDKLFELRFAQFRWNRLPAWISRHSHVQKSGL